MSSLTHSLTSVDVYVHLCGSQRTTFWVHFSPSTMYEDYAINDELFNWQSQSRTSIDSPTGKRYVKHRESGNNILLFVRENKSEDGVTSPYTYLGPADIVSHNGSKPISIVWKLRNKLPASIAKKAEKAL